MPHQCLRCNKSFADDAKEIVKGCSCGSKLFFYVKAAKVKEAKAVIEKLSEEQKMVIVEDVEASLGRDVDEGNAVAINLDSVRETSPGNYAIDLHSLLGADPLVHTIAEGNYWVDIVAAFKNFGKKEKK